MNGRNIPLISKTKKQLLVGGVISKMIYTPWKINMEPENTGPLEKGKIIDSKPSFSGSMLIFGDVVQIGSFSRQNLHHLHLYQVLFWPC